MPLTFRLLNTAIMSFLLSGFMTLYVTWINLGFIDGYLKLWLKAWVLAYPAAFVGVFILAPQVLKVTLWLLKNKE